jgi:hypothetical protein
MKTQKIDTVPSPWMLNKTSITGETNRAFIGDAQTEDEAIQSKALPWRREDDMGEGYSKIQEEFPPWIKNQDSPYESPTNTLMGKIFLGYATTWTRLGSHCTTKVVCEFK